MVTAHDPEGGNTPPALDGVAPFLIGTAVGGIAGMIACALLIDRARSLMYGLASVFGRRLSDAEREELRFELLLQ